MSRIYTYTQQTCRHGGLGHTRTALDSCTGRNVLCCAWSIKVGVMPRTLHRLNLRQRDIDKLALLSLDAYDYALETEKEHDDAIASSRRPPSPSSTGVKVRLEHH